MTIITVIGRVQWINFDYVPSLALTSFCLKREKAWMGGIAVGSSDSGPGACHDKQLTGGNMGRDKNWKLSISPHLLLENATLHGN